MTFATSAAEGAVLTAPEGSITTDLQTARRFHAYADANVESWYRFVNGTRGMDAKNGELRLVLGCDKATSYGTAVISNITPQRTNYLKFQPSESTSSSAPLYHWESSGLAEYRVGPDPTQVAVLREDDTSNVSIGGSYLNLCIFVRTLNLTLKDEILAAINREIEVAEKQQNKLGKNTGSTSQSNPNAEASPSTEKSQSHTARTTEGLVLREHPKNIGSQGENVTFAMSAGAIVSFLL